MNSTLQIIFSKLLRTFLNFILTLFLVMSCHIVLLFFFLHFLVIWDIENWHLQVEYCSSVLGAG